VSRTPLTSLLALALLATPLAASAESPVPSPHRISAYARGGATVLLASSRTAGGATAALGVRDTVHDVLVLQADVGFVTLLGSSLQARAGVGVQLPGLYSPMLLVTGALLTGERLGFRTPEQPAASVGPALTAGLALAPLRFCVEGRCASLLEVGLGYGADGTGRGPALSLGLLELGLSF
jgi:hypothetical protein